MVNVNSMWLERYKKFDVAAAIMVADRFLKPRVGILS
jgi:hypothetical protein